MEASGERARSTSTCLQSLLLWLCGVGYLSQVSLAHWLRDNGMDRWVGFGLFIGAALVGSCSLAAWVFYVFATRPPVVPASLAAFYPLRGQWLLKMRAFTFALLAAIAAETALLMLLSLPTVPEF